MPEQFTREFDPPHVPWLLDTYGSEKTTNKYRYRGFEFEMTRNSSRFLFFGYKWRCTGFRWPGDAIETNYSRGSIPGSVYGKFEKVFQRVQTDIDRRIEEDLKRQAQGYDSQYEAVKDWFDRNG